MLRRRSLLAQAAVVVILLAAKDARAGNPSPRIDPAERTLVAATRAGAEAQCDCARAATHRAYLRCVSQAVKALAAGRLSKGGMHAAMRCAARSTCGRAGMATCCRTSGSGRTRCAIVPAEKCVAPPGGSACESTFASWCDAVDQGCTPLQSPPHDINCCLPPATPGGPLDCEPQKPSECTAAGGTDMGGDGSCVPDPCVGGTTTTTSTIPTLCGTPEEQCFPPWSRTCPARGPGHINRECQDDCTCPSEPTTTTSTVLLTTTTATAPSTTVTTTTTSTSNTVVVTTSTSSTSSTLGSTTSSTVTTTSSTIATTTSTIAGCADCCGLGFTRLKTTNGLPDTTVTVGNVLDDSGGSILALKKGGLYFGGNGVGVPLPSLVPNTLADASGFNGTYTRVTSCAAGSFTLSPTDTSASGTAGAIHPNRHCSTGPAVANPEYAGKPGCLFGPPLAIPNGSSPATSTCVINRVSTSASGTGTCAGDATLSLPLLSDIYLTGPTDGLVPCPLCSAGSCTAGPNVGQACVAESSAIPGQSPAANPTSHDCPPTPAAFIGSLPIAFGLSTGSQTKTSVDEPDPSGPVGPQAFVFYGFCSTGDGTATQFGPLASPSSLAKSCTTDAGCVGAPATCGGGGTRACPFCRQRTGGAFGAGFARTITETGIAPGCLTDGAAHALTLVSVFPIPPSYNATVDSAADLPGPGAVSLPGTTQLIP